MIMKLIWKSAFIAKKNNEVKFRQPETSILRFRLPEKFSNFPKFYAIQSPVQATTSANNPYAQADTHA